MKELIERLRNDCYQEDEVRAHVKEAADALERMTAERDSLKEGLDGWHSRYLDILWLRHEAGNNEYVRQRALLVRARNLLSQPAHWGADDDHIKSRYALYTEISEHIAGEKT
jgi:hypothetical protein